MKTKSSQPELFIKNSILAIIGLLCFGYLSFARPFAELHILMPGLNIPVFIGEIVLGCLLLSSLFLFDSVQKRLGGCVLGGIAIYLLFVILKAVYGFLSFKTLALRDSALFYYPLFGVLAFFSWRKDFFTLKLLRVVLLSILCVFFFKTNLKTLLSLGAIIVVVCILQSTKSHRFWWFLLLGVCMFFSEILYPSRMEMVGYIVSFTFFMFFLSVYFSVRNIKAVGMMIVCAGLIFCLVAVKNKGNFLSFFKIDSLLKAYQQTNIKIEEKRKDFKPKEFPSPKVFNREYNRDISTYAQEALIDIYQQKKDEERKKLAFNNKDRSSDPSHAVTIDSTDQSLKKSKKASGLSVDIDLENQPPSENSANEEMKDEYVSIGQDAGDSSNLNPDAMDQSSKSEILAQKFERKDLLTKVDYDQLEAKVSLIEKLSQRYVLSEELKIKLIKGDMSAREQLMEILRLKHNLSRSQEDPDLEDILIKELMLTKADDLWVLHRWILVIRKERTSAVAINNNLFRLLLWKDVFYDLMEHRPLLGFSLGKPFRSESIEILGWAAGEWQRDGWIAMHNSYLNIIYRSGVIGLAYIIGLIWSVVWMARVFFKKKSLIGSILLSVIVHFLTMAQFGLILEMPYYAIPFWSLLGMLMAYADHQNSIYERALAHKG